MRRTHCGGSYRYFDGAYALRDRTHRQFDGNTQSYVRRRGYELSIASYTDISDDSTTVLLVRHRWNRDQVPVHSIRITEKIIYIVDR